MKFLFGKNLKYFFFVEFIIKFFWLRYFVNEFLFFGDVFKVLILVLRFGDIFGVFRVLFYIKDGLAVSGIDYDSVVNGNNYI